MRVGWNKELGEDSQRGGVKLSQIPPSTLSLAPSYTVSLSASETRQKESSVGRRGFDGALFDVVFLLLTARPLLSTSSH